MSSIIINLYSDANKTIPVGLFGCAGYEKLQQYVLNTSTNVDIGIQKIGYNKRMWYGDSSPWFSGLNEPDTSFGQITSLTYDGGYKLTAEIPENYRYIPTDPSEEIFYLETSLQAAIDANTPATPATPATHKTVDITFPLVFDLNTNTTMAGDDLVINDPDIVIDVDITNNLFQLEYKQGLNDTDEFNVEFVAATDSNTVSPFNDMKITESPWAYEQDQVVDGTLPQCKITSIRTGCTTSYDKECAVSNYPSKSTGSKATNLHSIIMQIIGEHYFGHPLATAPIENDDAIAQTVNTLLDTMKNTWNTSGSTQGGGDELLAKRSILEQFLNDAADYATNGANERFEAGTGGKTTLTLNKDGDKVSFLIYFTNDVTHDSDTTLLNNTGDKFAGTVDSGDNQSGESTNFPSFTKSIQLQFTKVSSTT